MPYVSTIGTTPISKAPKELAPPEFYNWSKKPTKENLGPLLTKLDPVIDKAVKSYGGGAGPSLKTAARLMAANYLKMFDPKKGMHINSYLLQSLQSLNRERAKRAYVVHIPENVLLTRNKLQKASLDFESEKGREPTLHELSDMTSTPIKAIENSKKYRGFMPESISMSEKSDPLFSQATNYERVWSDYVYHDLDDKDKKIFEWTTGYKGSTVQKKINIAKKLKISPAAVSLRINKIVRKLEEGSQVGV